MLLAIDPSLNSPGAAMFREGANHLVAATRISIPAGFAELPAGARWLHVAREITTWTIREAVYDTIRIVVFEKPQWDKRAKNVDPNDLVSIAGVAANVTGILSQRSPIEIYSPEPATWIGQLSKKCPTCEHARRARKGTGVKTFAKNCVDCRGSAWETPRGRRIRSRLTPAELALVPDQNDAIDAVGLGLWQLGRLTPRTFFSNGRDGR